MILEALGFPNAFFKIGGDIMNSIGFKVIENEAYLNGHKLSDLAKIYKTPLYVMDDIHLNYALNEYKTNFKGKNFVGKIVYASKAFITPYIMDLVSKYDFYMDAVSLGDLYLAKRSGFDMRHIVFHGNNKSIEELTFALENKVGIIVVDNLYELNLLSSLVKEKVDILIRVNPGIDAHTHKYIQTAKFTSKFGESIYDEEIIDKLISKINENQLINLLGFHAHIGSQIHETEAFSLEVDKMVDFQNNVAIKYNLTLPVLNLGGGFGIKYTKDEKALEICQMMKVLSSELDKKLESSTTIKTVMIEPGRSIVGPAGMTLYTISQIKPTYGGKNYLFVDGGMTDNIRPALYGATYECDVVNKMNMKKEIKVDIVGKCCESGDIIREDVLIPNVSTNDVLVVYATGAYNYSMSSNYNSILKPMVIAVGEDVKIISKRETIEDLYRLF